MPQAELSTLDMKAYELEVTDNLEDLLAVLPTHVSAAITTNRVGYGYGELIEIVLDLGRRPEARYHGGEVDLSDREVNREDLAHVAGRIGQFGDDNRAGIERTLHRISAIRNRSGDVVGLTCRIGRAVYGTIAMIRDLVEAGESVLLLGRPGVGKTTMLRETARVLADELSKRVIIVDTSNEIAGDGDIPHPGIGRARRMQVPTPTAQHSVMIEAVENHMPEVIVIDEIGTELEALAARTIAERGVQLIGTAHGNSLENLMMNPTLADLIGGIQSVTLSDEEARRRGTQKSILERKAPPTFGVMIELISRDEVAVYSDVTDAVDVVLRGGMPRVEVRHRSDDGQVHVTAAEPRRDPRAVTNGGRARMPVRGDRQEVVDIASRQVLRDVDNSAALTRFEEPPADIQPEFEPVPRLPKGRGTSAKPLRVYPFGVSRNRLEQTIELLSIPVTVVRDQRDADIVMTLKNHFRRKPQPLREAEVHGTPVYVLRANTGVQIENVLRGLFPPVVPESGSGRTVSGLRSDEPRSEIAPDVLATASESDTPLTRAMVEAEDAITRVIDGAPPVELTPQGSHVRRLQHELAERYNVASRSRGREPNRRVEIFRIGAR
jgi:stage III sporulation protein SpoIIIAA